MTHEKDAAAGAHRGHGYQPGDPTGTRFEGRARGHRLGIHKRDRVLTSRKPTCVLGHFPTGGRPLTFAS